MKKTVLTFSILALTISSHLQAQETTEHIIVTGSRAIENIDEVPGSITVIGKTALTQQLKISSDIQSLLALHVPGLSSSTGTSSNFG